MTVFFLIFLCNRFWFLTYKFWCWTVFRFLPLILAFSVRVCGNPKATTHQHPFCQKVVSLPTCRHPVCQRSAATTAATHLHPLWWESSKFLVLDRLYFPLHIPAFSMQIGGNPEATTHQHPFCQKVVSLPTCRHPVCQRSAATTAATHLHPLWWESSKFLVLDRLYFLLHLPAFSVQIGGNPEATTHQHPVCQKVPNL